MPNKPKTPATSIRLTADDRDLIDSLGRRLTPEGADPLTLTEVVRLALRRLDAAEKKSQKKTGKVY